MKFVDKRGVLARLHAGEILPIELGCGPNKQARDAIGVDLLDFDGVDVIGDVFDVLAAMPDACLSACYSAHFFEHVDDLSRLLEELSRALVPGAQLTVKVPHFSNAHFYSDPTHSRFFGLYTMSYYARDGLLRRQVPKYGREPSFELERVRLGFASPFPVRNLIRKSLGAVFNLTEWLQEFYEENLCYLLSCYEIEFRLRRL